MSKKYSKGGAWGWGLALFLALCVSGQLAPFIALVVGVIGFFYALRWITSLGASTSAPPPPLAGRLTRMQEIQLSQLQGEVMMLHKKISRPANRWQTQVERIKEASMLKARVANATHEAGPAGSPFAPLATHLDQSITYLAHQCVPDLNRHFLAQTDKLKAITTPARAAKLGESLLEQLTAIAKVDVSLQNIADTLARPIREMTSSASYTNTFAARLSAAQRAEKAGEKSQALSDYLSMLYDLKTDAICDEAQANEIADLEDKVRKLVLSHVSIPRRRKAR